MLPEYQLKPFTSVTHLAINNVFLKLMLMFSTYAVNVPVTSARNDQPARRELDPWDFDTEPSPHKLVKDIKSRVPRASMRTTLNPRAS